MRTEYQDKDLLTVLKTIPSLRTFVKIITQTGLDQTLKQTKSLTVFAPNDNAFAKWPQTALAELLKNPTRARDLLAYHLAEPSLFFEGMAIPKIAQSLQGESLSLNPINEPTVNNVRVLEPDIVAFNGVIHIIYKVLVPYERV